MGDLQTIHNSLAEHKGTTPAHTVANVSFTSTLVLAANSDRLYALFVNDSGTVIYLRLGGAAVLNEGIRLNANGGAYEINWTNLFTGAVYGIHGAGVGQKVIVTEVT